MRDVSEKEYAAVSQQLDVFRCKYNYGLGPTLSYGDTLRSIFGSVSTSSEGIPKELTEQYLAKGYSRNDRVGKSYLGINMKIFYVVRKKK